MPNTESDEPILAKFRNDTESASCKNSTRESVDPRRDIPKIDKLAPSGLKLRRDKELPSWEQPKIENAEPSRDKPNMASEAPKRKLDLKDKDDPMQLMSNTASEEP
jgi:hypothetical protein